MAVAACRSDGESASPPPGRTQIRVLLGRSVALRRLAAGYVRGVQSAGVFATVKHFVGNEAEFERGTISSVIDERSLRELYLVPFELRSRRVVLSAS